MSKTTNKFSSKVLERALRLVFDHEHDHPSRWTAIESIAGKIDCAPQTLLEWIRKDEINAGRRPGVTDEMVGKMKALERALHGRRPTESLVHHSDRRSQYVSIRYTEWLTEAGIEPSIGSVGDSHDNALTESVIGLFRTEVIHRMGPWKSLEDVEYKTLEWVDCINHQRLLEPFGNIPPAEAEASYHAALKRTKMAA